MEIKNMNIYIREENTATLWKYCNTDAIFSVDQNERLYVISKWNLLGRFVKYIQDRNGNLTKKINETVLNTLTSIREENSKGKVLIYIKQWERECNCFQIFFEIIFLGSIKPVATTSFPAYYLADCIKNSRFSSTQIDMIVQQIKDQESLYPHQISGRLHPKLCDPRIIYEFAK